MELFTSFRSYPSRKAGLGGLSVFMASYLGWILFIKHKANIWVYPVLEVLALPQRIVFFALCLVFSVALYVTGEFINEQASWIFVNSGDKMFFNAFEFQVWVKEIKQSRGKSVKTK